jgi:hypothetical protein
MTDCIESTPSPNHRAARATMLLRLFSLDAWEPEWDEQALAALARSWFAAPLALDPGDSGLGLPGSHPQDGIQGAVVAGPLESLGDLLFHPRPPLALLKRSKDFFKRQTREYPEGSPAWQVAYLFYLLSIAAAGASQITKMAAGDFLQGIAWALGQPWVEVRAKNLLQQAADRLRPGSPSAAGDP